jgi:hypothetical protein
MFQAMVNVVMHQGFLGLCDSLLNGVELLGDVEAGTALLDHGDRRAKVTFHSVESGDDVGMTLV